MATQQPIQLVRRAYEAYETGDRSALEAVLSDDYTFYAPPDPGIDRAKYFERCWPNSQNTEKFEFQRLAEVGDEVLVTYECRRTDGTRFRNTEIFAFSGERISRTEVYFGWDV